MNGWQFQLRGKLVGHDHRRQVALLFNAGIEGQAGAEQQHAVDLLGNNQVDKGFFLLVLVRAVTNQYQIALSRGGHFNAADNFAEKGIADVGHNDQNGAGFVTFNVTAHRMRQITHLQRSLLNTIARALRDFIGIH